MEETRERQGNEITEGAAPDHLIKEYELCWQGMQLNANRLWMSASIFVSGSILALAWLAARPLAPGHWTPFWVVALIGLTITLVMRLYWKIRRNWELINNIEFCRSEQIEEHLKLWRIRYRLAVLGDVDYCDRADAMPRVEAVIKTVMQRLKLSKKELPSIKKANAAFMYIICITSVAPLFLIAWALVVTLGLFN